MMKPNKKNHRISKKRTIFFLAAFVSVVFQSCLSNFVSDIRPSYSDLLEVDVNQIEAISLNQMSQTEPQSIEEASELYQKDVLTINENAQTLPLSIADIRNAALAHNLDLNVEFINPSIANETVMEERAKFEAAFFGDIQYYNSEAPSSSQLDGSKTSSFGYQYGILKPLPTGGEIIVEQQTGRYETDNQFSLLNPSFDADLRFSISQPLLRDAGIKSNTHSIWISQLNQKMTDAETKLFAIQILAEADRAYWRIYGASQTLQVSRQQYQIALQQLHDAKLRVKAGAAPQIEIVRAESGVAARLEGIITSLTGLRIYERDLKRIMNRDDLTMDSNLTILPMTEPSPLGLKLNPKRLAEYAVQNRMEMLELQLQLTMNESSVEFYNNKMLPILNVNSSYNINGLGSNYGQAYNQISDGEYSDWSVGMHAEIPLGNKAASARLRRVKLELMQNLATKEQRQQAIEQEVYDAIDFLEQNWQRILASRQDVLFATRTYEAERKQFELGVRTSTDVLFAAERLSAAQLREIHALVDYQIAQVNIAYATGTLLGQAGVEWLAKSL